MSSADKPDPVMTVAAVARHLKVSRLTVRKWTASGVLPVWFVDDAGRPVYSLRTIEAHQRRAGELQAERAAS